MSDTLADVSVGAAEGKQDIPILFMHEVERTYRQGDATLHILNGAELAIWAGQSVALVAPSGAGKSTLLHIAGLLEHPDHGDVFIDGRATAILADHDRTRIRRSEIGFVYQSHHLLPEFTALENVALPLMIRRMARDEALQSAAAMLEKVGLKHRLEHMPGELSGGERQRAAVARALVTNPQCVLADEPTGNLDRHTAHSVFDLLLQLNQHQGTSLVVVTHDLELAAKMQRQFRLQDGQLTPINSGM